MNQWIVFEDNSNQLVAVISTEDGLQERMIARGIKVLGSLNAKTGADAVDYVKAVLNG